MGVHFNKTESLDRATPFTDLMVKRPLRPIRDNRDLAVAQEILDFAIKSQTGDGLVGIYIDTLQAFISYYLTIDNGSGDEIQA